jgi:opacity protein-like surface antigen
MRSFVRTSLALLMALAVSTPAVAQSFGDRVSFNASVGPSFANVGTTFATTAGLDVKLTKRVGIVGEFGAFPHAPFREAEIIAPPVDGSTPAHVNAYHWNGNLKVRPFEIGKASPYVTAGLGSFVADAVVGESRVNGVSIEDRRRMADFATNVGAGLTYRVNDWFGVGADYRTFFVHRDERTPRVNRVTAGVSLFLD